MLAVGWTVSAFGRILQMVLDKGLQRKRIQVDLRLLLDWPLLRGVLLKSHIWPALIRLLKDAHSRQN